MKKTKKIVLPIIFLIIIMIVYSIITNFYNKEKSQILPISSQKELEEIYNQELEEESIFYKLLKLPFSLLVDYPVTYSSSVFDKGAVQKDFGGTNIASSMSSTDASKAEETKEYSTTNIQVENVDEADITKTDGNYIYSLSENAVIITDVRKAEEMKVVAKIADGDSNTMPEDLLLYQDKLVVIYEKVKSNFSYYSSYNNKNTTYVAIYNISNPEEPKEIKNYEIEQSYYTSRCIEGKLYVIASGRLRKEKENIITYYQEDGKQIDPGFSNISRIKDLNTDCQTILSMFNLNKTEEKVKISSYLMNIENAYVSENNIYLLDEKYSYSFEAKPINIFGWKGLLAILDDEWIEEEETGYHTEIYKFNLLEDGSIKFDKKASEKGKTINQFSIDEYENNLRVALYDEDGSRVVIFDQNMKKIGETEKLAEGEKMYSSRFLGNKAYLVTYKTIDPLFVVDLSNPTAPKVLGKLKIPGYSTYLHPYDENHIIGIGMQTEEKVNRNASGKVISTTATITGMKMALFDVSDVNNPIQISDAIIGDKRTTSAILTNHKALLFSKEKQLLAIPVNNYEEDFELKTSSDTYSSMIDAYSNYNKEYISEGYFVYRINLTDGFQLKGTITHNTTKSKYSYYDNYNKSRLLRGLYIEDDLYTISEDYIKVNKLEDLQEISQLKIKEN